MVWKGGGEQPVIAVSGPGERRKGDSSVMDRWKADYAVEKRLLIIESQGSPEQTPRLEFASIKAG